MNHLLRFDALVASYPGGQRLGDGRVQHRASVERTKAHRPAVKESGSSQPQPRVLMPQPRNTGTTAEDFVYLCGAGLLQVMRQDRRSVEDMSNHRQVCRSASSTSRSRTSSVIGSLPGLRCLRPAPIKLDAKEA